MTAPDQCCRNVRKFLPRRRPHVTHSGHESLLPSRPLSGVYGPWSHPIERRGKMKKPATMVYGVDERPPITLTIVTGIQHVGVIAMFLIYPLVVSNQAKLDAEEVINILQMGMLVLAAAVLLQGLPSGPVGSRFLAPSIFTGVYLAPSMMAVKLGGMPLGW